VGTISTVIGLDNNATVHPHGRGDNLVLMSWLVLAIGSPPRAWGQFDDFGGPALEKSVHPHGRGDNLVFVTVDDGMTRFTPTGVGTI